MKRTICFFVLIVCFLSLSRAQAEDAPWDTLISGIEKHRMDQDLRAEFVSLCQESETGLINGKIDTGDGLFMEMDVDVFKEPGTERITTLKDGAVVVLTGERSAQGDLQWVQVRFLRISAYTQRAVGIGLGWVKNEQIR